MKFEIITLFPEYFELSLRQSLLGKALEKRLFEIEIVGLREFATDKHRTVDDTPYGGGGGMVLKLEPIDACLERLGYGRIGSGSDAPNKKERIILTSAAGKQFKQSMAIEYSLCERTAIICGHYLGVDERLLELYEIDEVSIGDYILTGGEPAAAVIVDSVARLIPKVLGNFESAQNDSYMDQMLGTACYTRPEEYRELKVPSVLMSGHHDEIKKFRRLEAIKKCFKVRPDLIDTDDLTNDELLRLHKAGVDIDNE
ncbi:MAG: tRNA (guanosine(37)-N1)-methyltransferase TrmD [bacterium]|nr:tRNA (guanosine(37)-N1)-methyltransferase TrmD [bacterium]